MKSWADVLSVEQAADILQVSTKTVYKLIKEEKLMAIKVGRSFRIPKVKLLRFLGIEVAKESQK